MKQKIITALPELFSIALAGLLIGKFLHNLNQADAEFMEGMSYEEKYNYLIEGDMTGFNENVFMSILIIVLVIGFHKLLTAGFKALFKELSKIRKVE